MDHPQKETHQKKIVEPTKKKSFFKPLFRSVLTSLALGGASLGGPKEAEAAPDPAPIRQSVSIPKESEVLDSATLTLLDKEFWNRATEKEIQNLIAIGANINAQDENGQTPTHLALINGNVSLLKVLIENGADLNIADKNGLSPAQIMNAHGMNPSETFFENNTPDENNNIIPQPTQQENTPQKTTSQYKGKKNTNTTKRNGNLANNPSFVISDEDLAVALSPDKNNISMDKNGNFINTTTGTIYTRDSNNPNILHGYDPDKKGKEQTIKMDVTPEGGISLNSSFDANPEKITLNRTINPDGSYEEKTPWKNGFKVKTVDTVNGTKRIDLLDADDIRYKSELIGSDGTKAIIDADRVFQKNPNGSAVYQKTNPDETSIEVEQDGKGLTRRTHLDKNQNPVLIEEEKNGITKYFKQGTDGYWYEMPDPEVTDESGFVVDPAATAVEIEKLKNMSPEEVDEILTQQSEKETPKTTLPPKKQKTAVKKTTRPISKQASLDISFSLKNNLSSSEPTPSNLFDDSHSIKNKVSRVTHTLANNNDYLLEDVSTHFKHLLKQGQKMGKNDPKNKEKKSQFKNKKFFKKKSYSKKR